MWNMKFFVISIIIGATEIVSKGLKITGSRGEEPEKRKPVIRKWQIILIYLCTVESLFRGLIMMFGISTRPYF
jgi:hypothetical protein